MKPSVVEGQNAPTRLAQTRYQCSPVLCVTQVPGLYPGVYLASDGNRIASQTKSLVL